MGKIKRYRTAWSRHHRSHGFGIHSPFAFRFVREVLCERLPYYSYEHIEVLRKAVIANTGGRWRHPRIISAKNAKMIFRIVNYFNPQHMLQVGTSYGVSSACMLSVNSRSSLFLYEPHIDRFPVVGRVLAPFGQAVQCYDDLMVAVSDYRQSLDNGEMPFILVNDLPDENDYGKVHDLLTQAMNGKAVIVMRNLSRKPLMKQLWLACRDATPHGQTFTNEKIAIIYATSKLQREDFFLWF